MACPPSPGHVRVNAANYRRLTNHFVSGVRAALVVLRRPNVQATGTARRTGKKNRIYVSVEPVNYDVPIFARITKPIGLLKITVRGETSCVLGPGGPVSSKRAKRGKKTTPSLAGRSVKTPETAEPDI